MGCFLACFGSSKDPIRRNHRKNEDLCRDQRHGSQKQPTASSVQDISASPTTVIEENPYFLRDKLEEQSSPCNRKKVTFDTNVQTYEPLSVHESTDSLRDCNKDSEKEKKDSSGKSSLSRLPSEDDSFNSSVGFYPPNHRYQNCKDSDDEADEFECEESDLDEYDDEGLEDYSDCDEDEDSRIVGQEVWSESIPAESVESRTKCSSGRAVMEEVNSPQTRCGWPEQEEKENGPNRNARDRSVYVYTVLNPVENLTQWKAVKSKGTPTKPKNENFTVEQEAPRISVSSEVTFKHSAFGVKSKSDPHNNQNQEIAVDASLSNWLFSSETTPNKKTSSVGLESIASEKSMSQGSNSIISIEDRPILGALTLEEIKQFSASSSPRRSPCRSPDEMPIIGTVGTYWGHTGPAKGSASAHSFKGIPNTTSKYREDKKVNWHSTPFETRLERALNRRAAEA